MRWVCVLCEWLGFGFHLIKIFSPLSFYISLLFWMNNAAVARLLKCNNVTYIITASRTPLMTLPDAHLTFKCILSSQSPHHRQEQHSFQHVFVFVCATGAILGFFQLGGTRGATINTEGPILCCLNCISKSFQEFSNL